MTIYKKLERRNVAALEVVIPFPLFRKIRLITRIQVPPEFRGKKIEEDLVKTVCEVADKEEFTLYYLIPHKNPRVQMAWLSKYGFVIAIEPNLACRKSSSEIDSPPIEELNKLKEYLEGND